MMFVNEMENELINQITMEKLVKSLIKLNKDKIQTDALEEYELLEK